MSISLSAICDKRGSDRAIACVAEWATLRMRYAWRLLEFRMKKIGCWVSVASEMRFRECTWKSGRTVPRDNSVERGKSVFLVCEITIKVYHQQTSNVYLKLHILLALRPLVPHKFRSNARKKMFNFFLEAVKYRENVRYSCNLLRSIDKE